MGTDGELDSDKTAGLQTKRGFSILGVWGNQISSAAARLPERGSQEVGEEKLWAFNDPAQGSRQHVCHILLVKQVTRLTGKGFDPDSCLSSGSSCSLAFPAVVSLHPSLHTGLPPTCPCLHPPSSTPLHRPCLHRRPCVFPDAEREGPGIPCDWFEVTERDMLTSRNTSHRPHGLSLVSKSQSGRGQKEQVTSLVRSHFV